MTALKESGRRSRVPPVDVVHRSRCAAVDGVITHYLDAGDGPPIVLLHSGEFGGWAYRYGRSARPDGTSQKCQEATSPITRPRLDGQESQTGRGLPLARMPSPTAVHRALRQSSGRSPTPFRRHWPWSCKMDQRAADGSRSSAPDRYPGRQRGRLPPRCPRC